MLIQITTTCKITEFRALVPMWLLSQDHLVCMVEVREISLEHLNNNCQVIKICSRTQLAATRIKFTNSNSWPKCRNNPFTTLTLVAPDQTTQDQATGTINMEMPEIKIKDLATISS